MPLILDCCTDEVIYNPPPPIPPPPVRPPNCCRTCPTLTIVSAVEGGGTWRNTISVNQDCLEGLTFTVQRSNSPTGAWTDVGVWTGINIIDGGLPLSQNTFYYRVVTTGNVAANCTLNCPPASANATRPSCCSLSVLLPGESYGGFTAPAYNFNASTGTLTFSFYIVNTTGNGCILSTPPAAVIVTPSQNGVNTTVTPAGWNPGNNMFQFNVTITNIDTALEMQVYFDSTSLCDNSTLPRKFFTVDRVPICCPPGSSLGNDRHGFNHPVANRLYGWGNYPLAHSTVRDINTSAPDVNGHLAFSAAYYGLHPNAQYFDFTEIAYYEGGTLMPSGANDDIYTLTIELKPNNTCGGNAYECKFLEFVGRPLGIGNPDVTQSTPLLPSSQGDDSVNNVGFRKLSIIQNTYHTALSSADTFWTDLNTPQTHNATPGNIIRFFFASTNPQTPPKYQMTGVASPPPHHLQLLSITNSQPGGSINVAQGLIQLPNPVGNSVLTFQIKVGVQPGQGYAPHVRTHEGVTPSDWLAGNDRLFILALIPRGSNTYCDRKILVGFFKLCACNQNSMRGTIPSTTAVPVGNGNSGTLTFGFTGNRPTSLSHIREADMHPTNGRANLIRCNRYVITPSKGLLTTSGKEMLKPAAPFDYPLVNTHAIAGVPAAINIPAVLSLESVFTRAFSYTPDLRDCFHLSPALPYRVSIVNGSNFTNRVSAFTTPKFSHLISYEIAKIIESQFNTIFPATNQGFWSGFNDGATTMPAGTYPANSYDVYMNLNPIISYLQARVATDFKPCCGFSLNDFRLSIVLFSEVGNTSGFFVHQNTLPMQHDFVSKSLGGNQIGEMVCSPSNFVLELSLNLSSGTVNSFTYRNEVLATHTTSTPLMHAFCPLYDPTTDATRTMFCRRQPFQIDVTQPTPGVFRFRNATPILIEAPADRIGFFPLKTRQWLPNWAQNNQKIKLYATNMYITTMNLCPGWSSGGVGNVTVEDCNYNYSASPIYGALGTSAAHIINPRIKAEIVTDGGQMTAANIGATGVRPFVNGLAFREFYTDPDAYAVMERKAVFTSPYCNILTPIIKLNRLAYLKNPSNNGVADIFI